VLVARTVRTGVGDEFIASDSRLRRLAAVCGARVVDAFYTADRLVQTAREKAALSLLADAVEMESYPILEEARKWRVPALAIRVVGDAADADLPLDFNRAMKSSGRLSLPRLLAQLARQPRRLPGLLRLSAESRRAATKLAAFLDSYLETLAGFAHEEDAMTHKVTG
jgi:nucleoside phosphorylase